jgi:DNA-binding NarL/FixJ family response regulator
MIRVLICDDQDVVCEGLRVILSAAADISVVGSANDGEQAVAMVEKTHPDVVLMDLKMPVMNGVQATRQIRSKFPETRVLVLTTYDADEWVFDAIRSGAAGYLLKDAPREDLIAAIKGTASGRTYLDPDVAGKILAQVAQNLPERDQSWREVLSERELAVLRLLAGGQSNASIAEQLYLSEGTVRNYVSSILTKLDAADRTQAAVIALRAGLVDLSDL